MTALNKSEILENQIAECDIKILEFVDARGKADIASIARSLPRVEAVPLRVKRLAQQRWTQPDSLAHRRPIPDSSYLVSTGENPELYQLTDMGKIALQDNELHRRKERKLVLLKSVLLPLVVSLLTTLAANAPQWLLPLLQKWAEASHP